MLYNYVALLGLVGVASAHMHLFYPPTLKGDNNPYTQGEPDSDLNYPYGCCGRPVQDICKGHLGLLDTDEGQPTATWAPGQAANFSLSGEVVKNTGENPIGGTHFGGSGQVGFSVDNGKTFKVVKTWQGGFPRRLDNANGGLDPSNQVFDFTVPADLPSGKAVFAWTWVNREKEFNMNCASVTISGDGQSQPAPPAQSKPSEAPKQAPNQPEPSTPAEAPEPYNTPEAPAPSPAPEAPESTKPGQYSDKPGKLTLEGCQCHCPMDIAGEGCVCWGCESPSQNKRDVERKATALHRRNLANAEKLNVPVRRAESVAFNDRPEMLLNIDFAGAKCHSAGDPNELKFPNPGPDVEIASDANEYPLVEPVCDG
jgi:hypothetical protein